MMKEGKEVGERGRERGEVDPPCAVVRGAGTGARRCDACFLLAAVCVSVCCFVAVVRRYACCVQLAGGLGVGAMALA